MIKNAGYRSFAADQPSVPPVAPRTAHRDSEPNPAMVREGYGTSGEGNGTTVGHLKVGTGEVTRGLARDPNGRRCPDRTRNRASPTRAAATRAPRRPRADAPRCTAGSSPTTTLKKAACKSLGWSLIAVRALANPPLSCGFSSDTDVTARTQHSGFEPPDRSETPTFCRSRRCERARGGRADVAHARLLLSEASSRATFSLSRAASPDPASAPTRRVPDSPPRSSARLGHPPDPRASTRCLLRRHLHPGRLHGGNAAVVPFSSIGPAHAVDADTATTFNEHMGVFDDENAVAPVRGRGVSNNAAASTSDARRADAARGPTCARRAGEGRQSPRGAEKWLQSLAHPSRGGAACAQTSAAPVGRPEASAVSTGGAGRSRDAYAVASCTSAAPRLSPSFRYPRTRRAFS